LPSTWNKSQLINTEGAIALIYSEWEKEKLQLIFSFEGSDEMDPV
jgi:predicted nucleic acid-binding protein